MKKIDIAPLELPKDARPTADWIDRLSRFNRDYQDRILRYFAKIKLELEADYPNYRYPGVFGEIDSITGIRRELADQRVWSWGDCRGLGIWSYFLNKGVVPEETETLAGKTIRLREFYERYCDDVYGYVAERYRREGRIPFLVDPATNRASDDPRNVPTRPGESCSTVVFAAAGLTQYGVFRDNAEALKLGAGFLEEAIDSGVHFRNVDHITKRREPTRGEGYMMVTIGVMTDTIKCVMASPETRERHGGMVAPLIEKSRKLADYILSNFYNPDTGAFWETNDTDDRPFVNGRGHAICDPGHSSEFCGFTAELCGFIDENDPAAKAFRYSRGDILAALRKIIPFIVRHGFSPAGVMYKNVDILTGQGVPDRYEPDRSYMTAPWWNVRELAAAALKVYQLTGDAACLEAYVTAWNACYRNYPNEKIGGLMVQTLDAETLAPLPFHPATGNLDPMHCPRAREREIEALTAIRRNLR